MNDVVFWLPAINPYWHERFKALADDGEVRFECWFNAHIDPMRSWRVDESDMRYPHTFLPAGRVRRAAKLVALYRRASPRRIFTFHFDPNLWGAWLHRLRGGHVALYALMTWDSWVKRGRMKEFAKHRFFSWSSSALTPGPDSDGWVKKYGARDIHRLHHAIDDVALAQAGASRVRSDSLRLTYVGRIIPEKGVTHLMSVFDRLRELGVDATLELVGSGSFSPTVEKWTHEHEGRARLTPFVQAAGMPEVYARCDVLLFPTLGDPYGLVVDEALASGAAVISSDRAGDITWRLADGRGIVLPADDVEAWVSAVAHFSDDRARLDEARASALRFSSGHNVTRWVSEIKDWIARTA